MTPSPSQTYQTCADSKCREVQRLSGDLKRMGCEEWKATVWIEAKRVREKFREVR